MTAGKISERIHLRREAYGYILSSSVKINPEDLKKDLETLIKECAFLPVSIKIIEKFGKPEKSQTANEIVIFHFDEKILTEIEILQIMENAGYIPATLCHLLCGVKNGLVSDFLFVPLGSKCEGVFSVNPSIRFAKEGKYLTMAIEKNWDKRYAFPAVKKEGLCE